MLKSTDRPASSSAIRLVVDPGRRGTNVCARPTAAHLTILRSALSATCGDAALLYLLRAGTHLLLVGMEGKVAPLLMVSDTAALSRRSILVSRGRGEGLRRCAVCTRGARLFFL